VAAGVVGAEGRLKVGVVIQVLGRIEVVHAAPLVVPVVDVVQRPGFTIRPKGLDEVEV